MKEGPSDYLAFLEDKRAVVHARKPVKKATATALLQLGERAAGLVKAAADTLENGHCEREACPYRGLSAHIAQVRVQELVRGGLTL